jgi:phosphatidylserine/phosphatidylglycerophosphate/cardiolipin synthase-like enzyme
LIIVDGRYLYVGSANFTGAGLGVKGTHRRNFEVGIFTQDETMLDETQALFDAVWRGAPCGRCALRDRCEMPLDELG